jgi:hypothetical protein
MTKQQIELTDALQWPLTADDQVYLIKEYFSVRIEVLMALNMEKIAFWHSVA